MAEASGVAGRRIQSFDDLQLDAVDFLDHHVESIFVKRKFVHIHNTG